MDCDVIRNAKFFANPVQKASNCQDRVCGKRPRRLFSQRSQRRARKCSYMFGEKLHLPSYPARTEGLNCASERKRSQDSIRIIRYRGDPAASPAMFATLSGASIKGSSA
jgi:hypothetical protein